MTKEDLPKMETNNHEESYKTDKEDMIPTIVEYIFTQ